MNRNVSKGIGLAVCLLVAACSGEKAPAESPGTTVEKGMLGVYYYVNVSRPTGGTIRSADLRINCGTAGTPTGCVQARYAWSETASLTAVPDAGQYFQSWAADCSARDPNPCVLGTASGGADKWVVAVFNPPERLGHGDITSPSVHAPKFFAFLGNDPGAPRCTNCHGASYAGQGIAPSCNACHAAAGWASWQQSCSFCHGRKDGAAKAGYDFAVHPDWAAPPDDVQGRLTGLPSAAAGAHQAHVATNVTRAPIACSECHLVPATAIHTLNHSLDLPFGPLSRTGTANPTWDAATLTCGSNYCHGNFSYGSVRGKSASISWTGSLTGCTTCHEMPPTGHAYSSNPDPASCAGCHGGTVNGDGTINVAGGLHINGQKDASGGACDSCHWFPNSLTRQPTGAHLAHYGLTADDNGSTGYGDLGTLETQFPLATPTAAPTSYAFGCGNCHPISMTQHSMGSGSNVAKVSLHEAGATASSLKALNPSTAAFDATTKTCSNVYCHSSGQETTPTSGPTYVVTPAWNRTETTKLACNACHANPPSYASGGAGLGTANSHVQLSLDGWEFGHFGGLPGPNHYGSKHGGGGGVGWPAGSDSAPITCQTCHFETTDPASTGTSNFYWLDTTGTYQLPGGLASRRTSLQYAAFDCLSCHTTTDPSLVTRSVGLAKTGQVLPFRHVNGTRDVTFDRRTSLPAIGWLPDAPNRPTMPYWTTNPWITGWPSDVVTNGTNVSFSLTTAAYNPRTKSCSNVVCHLNQGATSYTPYVPLVWGEPYSESDWMKCDVCHQY